MARYPKQHLEVLEVPMAVLAIDTIGHLPITSNGNRWALTGICLHTPCFFAVPMKKNLLKTNIQAYLSNILTQKFEV